jgi:hypothetical protein
MKLLILLALRHFVTASSVRFSFFLLSKMCSDTHIICILPLIRETVSHPHETAGRPSIIGLIFSVFLRFYIGGGKVNDCDFRF